jgi:hypothetical protein
VSAIDYVLIPLNFPNHEDLVHARENMALEASTIAGQIKASGSRWRTSNAWCLTRARTPPSLRLRPAGFTRVREPSAVRD